MLAAAPKASILLFLFFFFLFFFDKANVHPQHDETNTPLFPVCVLPSVQILNSQSFSLENLGPKNKKKRQKSLHDAAAQQQKPSSLIMTGADLSVSPSLLDCDMMLLSSLLTLGTSLRETESWSEWL